MRSRAILGAIGLGLGLAASAAAQQSSYPQNPPPDIASRVSEIQAQEDELRTRAKELDEEMRPENIERSLAGVGSTRPEELRENRRRQLETEKNRILAQIAALEDRRVRLQTATAVAEAAKAEISAASLPPPPPSNRHRPRPKKKRTARHRQ
jgi:hypothetical protein